MPFRWRAAMAATALLATVIAFDQPAHAADSDVSVREAQFRLAELGYFAGRYDGLIGPVTESALVDFQRRNGLAVTGTLSPATENLLLRSRYDERRYAFIPTAGYYDWTNRWEAVRTQTVANRFAKLDITENVHGSLRDYTVTINGQAVALVDNQPAAMRVSHAADLGGEDAVIFTAYRGEAGCPFRTFLLTTRADGTYVGPREVGNCGDSYEAHVANNALYIDFRSSARHWESGDIWRYENANLIRL